MQEKISLMSEKKKALEVVAPDKISSPELSEDYARAVAKLFTKTFNKEVNSFRRKIEDTRRKKRKGARASRKRNR